VVRCSVGRVAQAEFVVVAAHTGGERWCFVGVKRREEEVVGG